MNVNGREYTVERLPITRVIEFAPEVVEALGPSMSGLVAAFDDAATLAAVVRETFTTFQSVKITAVLRKSIAQCITPENTYLSKPEVFETWFMQHPEDLFMVGFLAAWELVKDFLPLPLATKASALLSKVSQSQSPKDGK